MIRDMARDRRARRRCLGGGGRRSPRISPTIRRRPRLLRTGALYGMVHAAALLAVVAIAARRSRRARRRLGFAVGIVLFSVSLFALAAARARRIGWATPFGGVALIVGWAALAILAFQRR